MNTTTLYQQALLAEAAYADLEGVTTIKQFTTALTNEGKGFSETQAAEFVSNYEKGTDLF